MGFMGLMGAHGVDEDVVEVLAGVRGLDIG